jgi:hypothetical protein
MVFMVPPSLGRLAPPSFLMIRRRVRFGIGRRTDPDS